MFADEQNDGIERNEGECYKDENVRHQGKKSHEDEIRML